MKKFFLLPLLIASIFGQTNVQKNASGVISNGPITIGSSNVFTVASGGNITLAAGANLNGFTAAYLPASGVTAGAYTNANITVDAYGRVTVAANGSGGGGSGTVTSVSASNLALLFTTNVATSTTTPAITFTIANASANTVIAGPVSGSAAPLAARALVIADIPSLTLSKISDAGNSASRNVGTTAGTVAAGDDSRIVNAMQTTQNLAGLASTSTSLTNLGATVTGKSFFTTTDPSAIAYPRVNANNTLTYLSAAGFRTDIGLGGAAILNVGTTAGTVMAGDDSRVVTAIHFVSGLSASDGAANAITIQAALDVAATTPGKVMVVIPSGLWPLSATVNIPLGVQCWGQGANQGGTSIIYSGNSYAFKAWAPNTGVQLLWGGKFSNILLTGTSAAIGGISISDTGFFNVDHCSFRGFTGTSAATGYCIELKNINQWTEETLLSYNDTRDSRTHYKFTYTGTGTGTNSFAHTQIIGAASVFTGANDSFILADAGSNIYSSFIEGKLNSAVPSLTSPTIKHSIIALGDGAVITRGKLYIFHETQLDHLFWRFKLGNNSSIDGQGYINFSPSVGMSSLLGSANYYDSLTPTSTVYLSPGGEFIVGSPGSSKISAGQWTSAQRAAPANNNAYPVLYLSPGSGLLNLLYTDATHFDSITVRATAFSNGGGADSTSVTIIDHTPYSGAPVFDLTTRPFWKRTGAGNFVLYVKLSGISGGDSSGYITASGVLEMTVNAGTGSDFLAAQPMVLLPDMTGKSVGAILGSASQPVTDTSDLMSNALLLGGGFSVISSLNSTGTTTTVLHGNASGAPTWGAIVNADITNSTIDLGTKVTGNLAVTRLNGGVSANSTSFWRGDGTWAVPPGGGGSGNVTAASSTAGDIMVGAGAGPAITSNSVIQIPSAGNATINGNFHVTGNSLFDGNQTIGNLSVTAFTVSGNITGNASTGLDGAIYIGETAGHTFSANIITSTANQTTVTNGPNSITIGTVQAIGTTSSPQFSNVRITASTLTFNATTTVDFTGDGFKTETLTGVLTLASSNLAAGRSVTIRLIGDSVSRALTFPGGWTFIGAAAPSALAGSKTAVLTLTSFGTTDANVVAAYAVQP